MVCAALPWQSLLWLSASLVPLYSSAEPSGRAGTTLSVGRECKRGGGEGGFRRSNYARASFVSAFFSSGLQAKE